MKLFNRELGTKEIVYIGLTAAVYTVATVLIAPLSYGAVQFRFSEILNLLVFIDPIYAPGLVLGCFIANLFSPLGWVDVVFGTLGTLLSVIMIARSKNLFIASLWPTIFSVIVGLELHFVQKLPFLITTLTVMLGEFVVVTLIGYPVFNAIMRNRALMNILKLKKD
ncbi:QueT transporter family protein [Caldicellulosiruptoraceae bacterium PP1]